MDVQRNNFIFPNIHELFCLLLYIYIYIYVTILCDFIDTLHACTCMLINVQHVSIK